MDMVRKNLWLIGLCVWFLLGAGPARAQNPLQALYKAAKAEGEVVFWSPIDPPEVRTLVEDFSKEFPGIKVTHFEIRSDDYAPRFIAESKQGIVNFDIGTSKLTSLTSLFDRGLVQSYGDWTTIFKGLKPAAVSTDGTVLTVYSLVYPIAYNTRLVKPGEVPKSWNDLLAPKWKGRIILEPRAGAFAYLGLKWGKEKMVNYLKKLRTQDPIFVKGGTGTAQQLVAGAAPLAVGAYVHKILQMQNDGAPIDWAKKVSPIGAANDIVFAAKGAPHPNAGKLFAGWLASDKAQKLINKKLFRGALYPGSTYIAMRDIEKNNIEVIEESLENYRRARALNKAAVQALGVLR